MKNNVPDKIKKYIIDLSVVVVGIAITFSANNLVNSCNERNDLQLYLDALKIELEENLIQVKGYRRFFDENAKFTNYLQSVQQDKLNRDSLLYYDRVSTQIISINFKTGAFEMFKTSGVMRLIKDKDFIVSIMESYSQLEGSLNANEAYMARKMDELYGAIAAQEGESLELEDMLPENKRLYNFFVTRINMEQRFEETQRVIEKTLQYMK